MHILSCFLSSFAVDVELEIKIQRLKHMKIHKNEVIRYTRDATHKIVRSCCGRLLLKVFNGKVWVSNVK